MYVRRLASNFKSCRPMRRNHSCTTVTNFFRETRYVYDFMTFILCPCFSTLTLQFHVGSISAVCDGPVVYQLSRISCKVRRSCVTFPLQNGLAVAFATRNAFIKLQLSTAFRFSRVGGSKTNQQCVCPMCTYVVRVVQVMYGRVKGVLPIQTPPYREPALDADCHCSFISPTVEDPLHLQEIKSQVGYHQVASTTAIRLRK